MTFGRLNVLIIEAQRQLQRIRRRKNLLFEYTNLLRTKAQKCLLGAGVRMREELLEINGIDFSPSARLDAITAGESSTTSKRQETRSLRVCRRSMTRKRRRRSSG
jgi:hypothetical protein